MTPRPLHRALAMVALIALLAGLFVVSPAPAQARGQNSCSAFRVTVNGRTFSGGVRTTIPANQLGDGRLTVRGEFAAFGIDLSTFTVRNYTLRGTTDATGLTSSDVILFAQKRPLHGIKLTGRLSLRLDSNGGMLIQRSGKGQTMKIQARNCSQGSVFQMDAESATRYAHTLGSAVQYCRPALAPDTLLIVRRDTPRTANGDFVLTSTTLLGHESPQASRLLLATNATSRWRSHTGGRLRLVLDAATNEMTCRAVGQ